MRARAPRGSIASVAIGLLALLPGCRLNVEHLRDGEVQPAERLARLAPGKSTLDDALLLLGAPDGLEWTLDQDVLVYEHWTVRRSHFEVENPVTFVSRITPQSLAGEAVAYVVFAATRTGRGVDARPRPPGAPRGPVGPGFTSKPLTLEGDTQGRERVRLLFDRKTGLLVQVEVLRGTPGGGFGGVARGTFLR